MRQTFLLLFFAAFLHFNGHTQLGVKAGFSLATLNETRTNISSDDIEKRSILTPVLGLTFNLALTDRIHLQPELLYSRSGGRNAFDILIPTEVEHRIEYLEVPVLAKLQLGSEDALSFYVAAGPWVGYALKGQSKTTTTIGGTDLVNRYDYTFDGDDDEKRFNYGLTGAAGIGIRKLSLDLRYNYGVNNLLDDDADNNNDNDDLLQTRGLALTLGYRF